MKLLFDHIPKIAQALSGGSVVKTMCLMVCFWYFAITRKLLGLRSEFTIIGEYNRNPITFYLCYVMDLAVLREVFVDKEYEWCPIENPKIIIDLGAHFGDTALYYHARFPDAKIIAVEPSPENYERLIQHTQQIPNIVAVQAAVGAKDEEVELYTGDEFFGHSIFSRNEKDKKITVSQIALDSLFQAHAIDIADLIKFDIEGAEFSLFSGLDAKKYAKAYIGEIHLDLGNGSFEQILPAFNGMQVEKKKFNLSSEREFVQVKS